MSQKRKLLLNLITGYLQQVTRVLCGFFLSRMILQAFGSEVNGLISSINQFLSVIAVTDMGLSTVIQSALYKPLAEGDNQKVSAVLVSAERFYRGIGIAMICYTAILAAVYPRVVEQSYPNGYVFFLIIVMSLYSVAEYLFGIVRSLLLNADQRLYVGYIANVLADLSNLFFTFVIIHKGYGILVVKSFTMFCFLLRPLIYVFYVARNYNIDWAIKVYGNPIEQKWNGIAQRISEYIITYTDNIVLTFFSGLMNVSIYSVYNMPLQAIRQMLNMISSVTQPVLGRYWVKDKMRYREIYLDYEYLIHTIATFAFGCTTTLIVPFVMVYTKGVEDVDYRKPLFAVIMTLATMLRFYHVPFKDTIMASGHFRQTQWSYTATAAINIAVSLACVKWFGLVGVAVGTFVAVLYMMLWQGTYIYRYLLQVDISVFIRGLAKNAVIVCVGIFFASRVQISELSYLQWIILAIKNVGIWGSIVFLVNGICDNKRMRKVVRMLAERGFGR